MIQNKSKNTKEIDWDSRFKSICNFCKNYDLSPVLSTGSQESVIINRRLEILSGYLFSDLDPTIFDFSYSKGSGKVPKAPWIAINLRGRKVSFSVSFVICFTRTGSGLVMGLMSPNSYKTTFETIERTKINDALIIDYKDKNKYDNKFINPIDMKFDEISSKLIQKHKHASCELLLNNFSKKFL
jgi:hypothetical protein